MEDSAFIAALAASGGVLAGAVGQGVLWLWDKTNDRSRTAVIHFVLVDSVIVMAEKLAVAPLKALALGTSAELKNAVELYNRGLQFAAVLLLLVPILKWGYEWFSTYVKSLRAQQAANFALPVHGRFLIAHEDKMVIIASGIVLLGLLRA
jgi:hypothetical protein